LYSQDSINILNLADEVCAAWNDKDCPGVL